MITRKQHRLLGGILLLPFIAWSFTGIFFLMRPAYEQAYSVLSPKTYAADEINISAEPQWQEMRLLKTILGQHLLVKQEGRWQQLDPDSLEVRAAPMEADLANFVEDAISQDTLRYGELLPGGGSYPFHTSTGVTITVNWDSLSLYQQGADTRWIDRIYSIHYLQWTGIALVDSVLGVASLFLLLLLTITGSAMLLRRAE
jgi:hypothetical protein